MYIVANAIIYICHHMSTDIIYLGNNGGVSSTSMYCTNVLPLLKLSLENHHVQWRKAGIPVIFPCFFSANLCTKRPCVK